VNLYLLRHGIAEEPDTPLPSRDSDRQLTSKGVLRMRQIAKGMARLKLSFDYILSSPYARARQTAEIVAARFPQARFEFCDALTPSGSPKKLIEFIDHLDGERKDVLLVSHEPLTSELISLLISGQISASLQMKKGGLCKLSLERLRYGRCAILEWLLTPRQLRQFR
jgi:phosphohistidine phosphatase